MPPGRKRKVHVVRDHRGKSRAFDVHRTARAAEREAEIVSVALAQPHRRFASEPRLYYLGYPLGRLYYQGMIDRAQHDTGSRWCALVRRYAAMKGIRLGLPQAPLVGLVHEGSGYRWETSAADDDKRVRSVEEDYDACIEALLAVGRTLRRGRAVLVVCKRICIQEEDENFLWREGGLGELRLGLNALRNVWRHS